MPYVSPSGLPLAAVSLAVEQDIVFLCRQTRALGDEFGLQDQDVNGLSVATYELARRLREAGATGQAELALGEGPSLQVVVRARAPEALGRNLANMVAPLRPLVHDLTFSSTADGVTLLLGIPVPPARVQSQGEPRPEPVRDRRGSRSQPASECGEPALRAALRDIQMELDETNRGVVALYAELDERAERLRDAEDRLRLLLDSVQDYAILMINEDGTIASWNNGAERIFGYSAEEAIGAGFSVFYSAAETAAGLPALQLREASAHGRTESECTRARKGGHAFAAHWLLTAVRSASGELRGYSLVVRDITERKRLEDDLHRRAEELAAANRTKEEFLATLSHELRTPLNAMLGWTRLLRTGRLDPDGIARALETIERNARIQEQLIADILDVSRIVTGKLRLDVRQIELPTLLEAALDSIKPAADAKGIALDVAIRFRGRVMGDPDRLQQVVWNLLANALKFTPSGGRISVTLVHTGSDVEISVRDTGEGIAEELLPFVFDRFRQGDTSVTRPHGGLGLGLSIVRHIVELHGGQVDVTSAGPGNGATFTVRLPAAA